MKNINSYLEEILNAGYTPDSLKEEAIKYTKSKKEKEENQLKINEARNDVIKSYKKYYSLLTGDSLDTELFSKILKGYEKTLIKSTKTFKIPKEVKEDLFSRSIPLDEILKEFLS